MSIDEAGKCCYTSVSTVSWDMHNGVACDGHTPVSTSSVVRGERGRSSSIMTKSPNEKSGTRRAMRTDLGWNNARQ